MHFGETHLSLSHQQTLLFVCILGNERNEFGNRKIPVSNHDLFALLGKGKVFTELAFQFGHIRCAFVSPFMALMAMKE